MQELTVKDVSKRKPLPPNSVERNRSHAPAVLHRALDSLWEQAVAKAQKVPTEGFAELEKEFRAKILKLAAHMLSELIPLALGTGYQGSWIRTRAGNKAKFQGYRPRTITTLVQEIRINRAYYYCEDEKHGAFPLDGTLSLDGTSFSPGVREAICLLDAELPFERGRELLWRLSAVQLDKQEGRHITESLGSELERQTLEEIKNVWQPQKPVPREATAPARRLYISPDGTTAPMLKGFKEVKVGAVFTSTIPKGKDKPQRERTRYVATMENSHGLGRRLYVEALKMGLSEDTEVVAIGDGAHWIWNEMEALLPKKRVEIIDFYHASEKLWELSRAVFGEDSAEGKKWAERWSRKLCKSDVGKVIAAMRRLKPKGKAARECRRKTSGYFCSNRRRMKYREFRKKGYFIGSGVVEASCKNLIGSRLKRAGMRWTPEGAQAILQVRVAILNDRWDHMWRGVQCGHAKSTN